MRHAHLACPLACGLAAAAAAAARAEGAEMGSVLAVVRSATGLWASRRLHKSRVSRSRQAPPGNLVQYSCTIARFAPLNCSTNMIYSECKHATTKHRDNRTNRSLLWRHGALFPPDQLGAPMFVCACVCVCVFSLASQRPRRPVSCACPAQVRPTIWSLRSTWWLAKAIRTRALEPEASAHFCPARNNHYEGNASINGRHLGSA